MMHSISLSLLVLFCIFTFCFSGHRITENYQRICMAIYTGHWYLYPLEIQNFFIMIIHETQTPTHLCGWSVIQCTLPTFTVVRPTKRPHTFIEQFQQFNENMKLWCNVSYRFWKQRSLTTCFCDILINQFEIIIATWLFDKTCITTENMHPWISCWLFFFFFWKSFCTDLLFCYEQNRINII